MIRVKLVKRENFSQNGSMIQVYSSKCFDELLGGFSRKEEAPFRDKESLKFIEEIDHGTLVDGDWYSYISPEKRTCMCHLSGRTKYALTCIANSRNGIYTTYEEYDENIFGCFHVLDKEYDERKYNLWKHLSELEMDILIAFDIWHDNYGVPDLPFEFPTCIIENYLLDGKETEVIYDENNKEREPYQDEQGRTHVNHWCFSQYRYNWDNDLPNILQILKNRMNHSDHVVWNMTPVELSHKDLYERFCSHPYEEEYDDLPRKILITGGEYLYDGDDKYPRIFYIRHYRDGRYSVHEGCAGKYPDFEEVINRVVEMYDPECEEAFAAVFDIGCFYEPEHFEAPILWEFHDNGKELTCYCGELGLSKFAEFLEAALAERAE